MLHPEIIGYDKRQKKKKKKKAENNVKRICKMEKHYNQNLKNHMKKC